MCNADGKRIAQHLLQPPCGGFDVFHPVVQIVYLTAAPDFAPYGLDKGRPFMLHHVGLHALPVLGRLFDGGHIPYAAERHVQRPGNGRGGQGQCVHLLGPFAEGLLVADAEPLLLVNDQQTQILKGQILLQQLVGADEQVDAPFLDAL